MGSGDSHLPRLTLRGALLAGAALAAFALSLLSYETGALSALERNSIDARFHVRGTLRADASIVLVGLDVRSIKALNLRPPIPRVYYARLLDRIRAGGPRLIGVDVEFNGATDARDDKALRSAIARDGPILLATEESKLGPPLPTGIKSPPGAILASGSIDPDPDGILRRIIYRPLSHRLKTFAVRAAELVTGNSIGPADFPGNHALIDYRGPPYTFPVYSFKGVLDGTVPPSTFGGKVVFVGVTDPVEGDIHPTPMSNIPMPGTEIQANSLSTVLAGLPLRPASRFLGVVLLALLAAVPPLLSARLGQIWVFASAGAVLLAFLAVAQLTFNAGTIIRVPDPILALALGTTGALAASAYVERRQLHKLQRFFELLPSPVSDFFISYRRGPDTFVANTLRDELAARFGATRVFLDAEEIHAGQQFPERIRGAIEVCRAMLVIIGPTWLEVTGTDGQRRLNAAEDWVRLEVEAGLARDDLVVVPILYGGATMPRTGSLPPGLQALADRNAVSLTGSDLRHEIDALVSSMEKTQVTDFLRRPPAIG